MFKNFAGNIFNGIHANAHASVYMGVVGVCTGMHSVSMQMGIKFCGGITHAVKLRQYFFIPYCLVSAQVCLLLLSYL